MDSLELLTTAGNLGSEQPHNEGRWWPYLHLVGDEQRIGERAKSEFSGL
jgi:hypothetical protein